MLVLPCNMYHGPFNPIFSRRLLFHQLRSSLATHCTVHMLNQCVAASDSNETQVLIVLGLYAQ